MRLGVLIGNGFDLGLGLKTGYEDFIKYYVAKNERSPSLTIRWLCEHMQKDSQYWSDAEIAFGMLPFGENQVGAIRSYTDCMADFTESFHDYLFNENQRLKIPGGDCPLLRENLIRHILGLGKYMTPDYQDKFLAGGSAELAIDFLSFNYTDSLEQILGFSLNSPCECDLKLQNGSSIKVRVANVCHVHGTLQEAAIFGVDNEKQIADPAVKDFSQRTGGLLKARCEEVAGFKNRQIGMHLLDGMDAIITYGLSFGDSDVSWWSKLYNRVSHNNCQLIACPYSKTIPPAFKTSWAVTKYFLEEKKKVFRCFTEKDTYIAKVVESFNANQMVVLQKSLVPDGMGKMTPCDYLQLSRIKNKYVEHT